MGNTNGEEWRWQRKAANSAFNKRSLKNFVLEAVEFEIVNRLLPLLKKFEDEDKTIDLQDVLERFGFDNICKVAFSEDPNCLSEEAMTGDAESSKFMKAFDEAQKISIDRIRSPIKLEWKMKKLLNIGSEKHLRESVSIIHDYAMKIVRAKKKMNHDEHHDLLSSLASSREVSEEFTRDSITNLIFAGRDTVSSALTWFFWIISTRPGPTLLLVCFMNFFSGIGTVIIGLQ